MPGVETVAVHGTSQEITSNDELTVRLVRRLRSRGLPVTEIGGPGSTERSMLRVLALDDTLKEWGLTALDELPSFNLDYVPPVVAGALTGGRL